MFIGRKKNHQQTKTFPDNEREGRWQTLNFGEVMVNWDQTRWNEMRWADQDWLRATKTYPSVFLLICSPPIPCSPVMCWWNEMRWAPKKRPNEPPKDSILSGRPTRQRSYCLDELLFGGPTIWRSYCWAEPFRPVWSHLEPSGESGAIWNI